MKVKTVWEHYDHCEQCDATPGGPCFDLRYGRMNRVYHRDYPHRGRSGTRTGRLPR